MKIKGKYELQVIRNKHPVTTIRLNNTITSGFLELLSRIISGDVLTTPKYVGFGLGDGTGANGSSYTGLTNEKLRVPINSYDLTGTGILKTETEITSSQLQNAGITTVRELGIFCVNSTSNEATVSSTINTGTLVSRVVLDVPIQASDTFLIKRTDTITGG